jgi:hypothetical protein
MCVCAGEIETEIVCVCVCVCVIVCVKEKQRERVALCLPHLIHHSKGALAQLARDLPRALIAPQLISQDLHLLLVLMGGVHLGCRGEADGEEVRSGVGEGSARQEEGGD